MNIAENQTVGSIVAQDYRTASVFQKNGIDFCCKGGQTIDEVCTKKGIDKSSLLASINHTISMDNSGFIDYNMWPLENLITYIEEKHHAYVVTQTPVLLQFLNKLCKVHGERHPELFEINAEFNHVAEELAAHMNKEEVILFPFIRKMANAKTNNDQILSPGFGTVQNPITMMKNEHEVEGDRFVKIAELSNNYQTPADGCTTYRVAYQMLKDFEDDLHKHIHLENNILFPKSIELESTLA